MTNWPFSVALWQATEQLMPSRRGRCFVESALRFLLAYVHKHIVLSQVAVTLAPRMHGYVIFGPVTYVHFERRGRMKRCGVDSSRRFISRLCPRVLRCRATANLFATYCRPRQKRPNFVPLVA
eukprot:6190226-Pleurochrysis_carterae.AAC.2